MNKKEKTLIAFILFYCLVLTGQLFYQSYDIINLRLYTRYIETQNHSMMMENNIMKTKYIEASKYYQKCLKTL